MSISNIDVLRRIVLEIKKSKYLNILGNKFLEYEAKWNVVKMKYNGKCESEASTCFISLTVANFRILHTGSKLFHLGEVLLQEIIYYVVCMGGSDIDRRKFCRYMWDNLFRKSSVEKEYWFEISISDRNKKK